MSKLERCPICGGSGILIELQEPTTTGASPHYRVCHGCLQRGERAKWQKDTTEPNHPLVWGEQEKVIRADERKVMARELITEIDSHVDWRGYIIPTLIKDIIRKAAGL